MLAPGEKWADSLSGKKIKLPSPEVKQVMEDFLSLKTGQILLQHLGPKQPVSLHQTFNHPHSRDG